MALLVVVISVIATVLSASASPGYPQGSPIPRVYWPMYVTADEHYGVNPYLLASIHMQESGFSGQLSDPPQPATGVASGVNGSGCCAGPMQFNLSNTWEGHKQGFAPIAAARPPEYPLDRRTLASCRGVPADDGCVYDDFDAIAAAAHKLESQGADGNLTSRGTHAAVCAYIGDCVEVDTCREGSPNRYCEVLPRAIEWERMGAQAVEPTGGGIDQGAGELGWPTPPEYRAISSGFGMRWGRPHNGIDLPLAIGTPIGAADPGVVNLVCQNVQPCTGYGNFVCVEHRPDLSTCYAHLDGFADGVRVGAPIERGDLVGYGGNTGVSTGPHLHFEVRLGPYPAQAVDPVPYLG